MALARQYAPAQQPQYGPPVCEVEAPGPENAWGFEQLLGGESAVEPRGSGSVLEAFRAGGDKVDQTLDAADDVLGRALLDLRGAGASQVLADAEGAELLRTHLEDLLAERDEVEDGEVDALELRIEDHRDRLHIAVELVDAEHNAWEAVVGLGIAESLGPLMAVQATLAPRLARIQTESDTFRQTIEMHLGQLRGALVGLADLAAREQLDQLIEHVESGAGAIGHALGGALGPGLALVGEGLGKLFSDLGTGALVDAALGDGVDLPSRLEALCAAGAESGSLASVAESASKLVLEQASELIVEAIETDELMRQLDHFSEQGHDAILGIEDAGTALLLGSASSELAPTATELQVLAQGLGRVGELVAGASEDLETWRGIVADLRAQGGPDLFALL